MKRASMNRWHTERAISFAMEKVVVVVVVTIRDGSLGSGIRFDCENLRDPKLLIASSDVKVCSIFWKRTRCGPSGKLTIKVEKRSLKSRVNGLSSSVIRRSLDDVWCILFCRSAAGARGGVGDRERGGLRSRRFLLSTLLDARVTTSDFSECCREVGRLLRDESRAVVLPNGIDLSDNCADGVLSVARRCTA